MNITEIVMASSSCYPCTTKTKGKRLILVKLKSLDNRLYGSGCRPLEMDTVWPVLEDLEESPLELLTDLWGGATRAGVVSSDGAWWDRFCSIRKTANWKQPALPGWGALAVLIQANRKKIGKRKSLLPSPE